MSILDGSKQVLLLRESPLLAKSLLDTGWQQGALFSAPAAYFTWNDVSSSYQGDAIIQQRRKVKPGEKFVLITQDCDIIASEEQEPYAEALLCKTYRNQEFLSKIGRNSARWFVIDFDIGLVAESKYRVQFAKQVLKMLTPELWPGNSKHLEHFIRWLARRYDRPAIPDSIVEGFQRPVEDVLACLDKEHPDVGAIFTRAVHEVRISLPTTDNPPFDLRLVLWVKSARLTQEDTEAIDIFKGAVQNSLNPKIIHLDPEVLIQTEEEISLAEYRRTRPLFLEYHTYRGEETEGAEPYSRG